MSNDLGLEPEQTVTVFVLWTLHCALYSITSLGKLLVKCITSQLKPTVLSIEKYRERKSLGWLTIRNCKNWCLKLDS